MKNCTGCNSENFRSAGKTWNGRPRWICLDCGRQFSVVLKNVVSVETKKTALDMRLKGMSFEKIGKALNLNPVRVWRWMKTFSLKKSF